MLLVPSHWEKICGDCLSGGGGGGGGEGVQRGAPPSPTCRNVSNTQHIEKLLENDLFSTWKYHAVCSKQIKIFILGQFRLPSANHHTTNTITREIARCQPNHSDLFDLLQCSIEIDVVGNAPRGLATPFPALLSHIRTAMPLVHLCNMLFARRCMLLVSPVK